MSKTILDAVRYIIRAGGLAIFGIFSILILAMPLFGNEKKDILGMFAPLCGVWLLATVVLSWPRLPDAWRKDPPTQRQLEYAASLEIFVPHGISKGQLSDMISQATGRQ